MTEFVWLFGASGAGKATLIKKIAAGQFVLPGIGDRYIVCSESMEWGREQRLTKLENELEKYALSDSIVLIKGQASDLTTSRIPYNLKQKLPETKQRVIFVYTKPELLQKRTINRHDTYWPNPSHDFVVETAQHISEVRNVCAALHTLPIIVDNTASKPVIMVNLKITALESW